MHPGVCEVECFVVVKRREVIRDNGNARKRALFLTRVLFLIEENSWVWAKESVSKLNMLSGVGIGIGIGIFFSECGQTAQRYGQKNNDPS